MHEKNCFVTLTYNPAHLPAGGNLQYRDVQLFLKRLRKRYGSGIRYFLCGEYGEQRTRPHYHVCFFNFSPSDLTPLSRNKLGQWLYTSEVLNELWSDDKGESLGFVSVGELTFESAAYTARYITKKIFGSAAESAYEIIDLDTGEITGSKRPEFCAMSRRPGIGRPWLEKYMQDVLSQDFVVLRGKKMKTPKAYDRYFETALPSRFEDIKFERYQGSRKLLADSTWERLLVKEICLLRKFDKLERKLEK